jgi:hypothetical protein
MYFKFKLVRFGGTLNRNHHGGKVFPRKSVGKDGHTRTQTSYRVSTEIPTTPRNQENLSANKTFTTQPN